VRCRVVGVRLAVSLSACQPTHVGTVATFSARGFTQPRARARGALFHAARGIPTSRGRQRWASVVYFHGSRIAGSLVREITDPSIGRGGSRFIKEERLTAIIESSRLIDRDDDVPVKSSSLRSWRFDDLDTRTAKRRSGCPPDRRERRGLNAIVGAIARASNGAGSPFCSFAFNESALPIERTCTC